MIETQNPFVRDDDGVLHVVGLSGGHDSTALSLLLSIKEPRPYNYICTPTGDELPSMIAHWLNLGDILGRRIYPIMAGTLYSVIRDQKMLPNFHSRFCTRILKIEPYRKFLIQQASIGPVVSYVGLKADEPGRAGGAYDDIEGVTMRFPLREWNYGENDVQQTLSEFGVTCPDRTDCAICYHQRLGERYELWLNYPDIAKRASDLEDQYGHTFRTPGRDAWPSKLSELFNEFARGRIPVVSLNRMKKERMASGSCRVCSL